MLILSEWLLEQTMKSNQMFLPCVHTSSSLLKQLKSAPSLLRYAVEGVGRYFFTLASDLHLSTNISKPFSIHKPKCKGLAA